MEVLQDAWNDRFGWTFGKCRRPIEGPYVTDDREVRSWFALKTKRLAIDIDVDHRQITANDAVSTILSRLLSCLDSTDSPL